MKKFVCVLLCLLIMAGCASPSGAESSGSESGGGSSVSDSGGNAQGNPAGSSREQYLADKAFALTGLLQGLASDSGYMAAYSSSAEIMAEVQSIAQSLEGQPTEALIMELDGDAAFELLSSEVYIAGEAQKEYFSRKLCGSLPGLINSASGTTSIATASILSVSESYQAHQEVGTTAVFFIYDSDWSVCIIFIPSQEGTVQVVATPVRLSLELQEQLAAGQVLGFLAGLPEELPEEYNVEVSRLTGEELAALKD